MTITQTVDIPVSRKITLEVPPQIPVGKTIIAFTPADDTVTEIVSNETCSDDCPICAQNRNSETGELRFNAKALAAIAEGEAMMRGDIPVKWHKPQEFEQVWKELLED